MIYFSNVDINISKNIYDFLISQNFKEYMNNYKNKLMIFDFVAPIINDFKKSHTIRVGGFESFEKQIKGGGLMFVITPELEPFCVQFFYV